MPIITGSDTTREQSITDIIVSVALEQTALSHVLNAEGEKIQAMLKMDYITPAELLKVNDSVTNTVDAVSQLEAMLLSKLKLFGGKLKPVMPVVFTFHKKDKVTWAGLTGAVFELRDSSDTVVETATSKRGLVTFKKQYPGNYTLREITAPIGYHPDLVNSYPVVISADREVTINGAALKDFMILNAPYPNLIVNKVDDLDLPLAGGEFQLSSSGLTYKAKSNSYGTALFERVMPGSYTLTETKAPSGYRKSQVTHDVYVASNGTITVDSVATNTVTMKNKLLMDLGFHVIFSDSDDRYKHRPSQVIVHLYRNGVLFDQYDVHTGPDTYVLVHLLEKYDDNGVLYDYTILQEPISYYDTQVNGYTIVNTLDAFDITGTVTWIDSNNTRGLRPSSVTVRLFDGGTEIDLQIVTAAQNWEFTFTELPMTGVYTILEDTVSNYDTTYQGWNITNKIIQIVN